MAGYRWYLAVASVFVLAQASNAQEGLPHIFYGPITVLESQTCEPACCTKPCCKVYSLADLDDPNLCKWIAETIPEMIQPATWKQNGAKVSYYAPSKVLVINNTMAVHNQVDEFLTSMKKSTAQAKMMKRDSQVMQAQFSGQPERVGPVQTGPAGYPVPYPPASPKHLFHFIIRYEGEGIIDSNVVKFTKAMAQANAASNMRESGPGPIMASPPTYATPTTTLQPVPPPPPPTPLAGNNMPGTTAPFVPTPLGASPMPPADAMPTSTSRLPVQPMPPPMLEAHPY